MNVSTTSIPCVTISRREEKRGNIYVCMYVYACARIDACVLHLCVNDALVEEEKKKECL